MKLLFAFIISIAFISCRKNVAESLSNNSTQAVLRKALRDSLSIDDYNRLDFSKFIVAKYSNISIYRIGVEAKDFSEEFLLLKVRQDKAILSGFIIELNRDDVLEKAPFYFNGSISISSLNRRVVKASKIINGYIASFHTTSSVQRTMVVPSQSHVLPDVVVTTYITSPSANYSDNAYLNYMTFFNYDSQTSGSYYPLGIDQRTYANAGGNGGAQNAGINPTRGDTYRGQPLEEPVEQEPINVDFEFSEDLSAIKVEDYLKCFSNVPDDGAKCSIEILTDIPVDGDPDKLFNWNTGSPGHSFVQLRKENGSQLVMQNIGFYPVHGFKTLLTTAPVEGKLVENGGHEYNAGLKMDITTIQLQNVIAHILDLSKTIKYDIDDYNCTDFALDVFNYSRSYNPLTIPKYYVPFSVTTLESNTPQGVFNKLKSMQQSGIESGNITIPGVKGFVANGSGPCN